MNQHPLPLDVTRLRKHMPSDNIYHDSFDTSNKYYKIYVKLVSRPDAVTKLEADELGIYTEVHHKVPRSLGGSNEPENLVRISARKHFICHCLLTLFVKRETSSWYSVVKAFSMMKSGNKNSKRYFNSRLYEINRKNMSIIMSNAQKGKLNSQAGTIWLTNNIVNVSKRFKKDQMPEALEQGWFVGRFASQFSTKMKLARPKQQKEIKSRTCKQQIRSLNEGKVVMIHNKGNLLETRMLYYFRDYILEGWKILQPLSSVKGSVKLVNKVTKQNIMVSRELSLEFLNSEKWERGFHNPNHKGTSGKTYKWINGKKVFGLA